jgi:hypothetical protein
MSGARWALVVVGVALGALASTRWTLQAQDRAAKAPARAREVAAPRAAAAVVSVQDALQRPMDLPFAEDTPLESVRQYLGRTLAAPVVLDRSALDRLDLTPEDTVRIDLKGVRLKVGLKLLLDQVGLSYRVEPEDNLLILTDPESSEEPARRLVAELKSLHRDLHDLQDAVDGLRDLVEEDLGIEPEVDKHRSTIVRHEKVAPRRPGGKSTPERPRPVRGRAIRGQVPHPAGVGG